jgi:magnesium chelatase subunit H
MLLYITNTFFQATGATPAEVTSTPQTGCLHPAHAGYFDSPAAYMKWYARSGPLRGTDAPVAALLLYRKHVITKQDYIRQLVSEMEAQGVLPVPIFINGVEAHTVVRDLLTSRAEAAALAAGQPRPQGLKSDAVKARASSLRPCSTHTCAHLPRVSSTFNVSRSAAPSAPYVFLDHTSGTHGRSI